MARPAVGHAVAILPEGQELIRRLHGTTLSSGVPAAIINSRQDAAPTIGAGRLTAYLTLLSANAVTTSNASDGTQVTMAGFRLNTWPVFAIISLARK